MSYWHRYYRADIPGWKVTRINDPATVPQKDVIWLDTEPTGLDPTKMFYIEYDDNAIPAITFPKNLPGVATPSSVYQGDSTTVSVEVKGGIAPYSYQWKKVVSGSTFNVGSNQPIYTIDNFASGNVGDYYVTVTDARGKTADSDRARMQLIALPTFSTQPPATLAPAEGSTLTIGPVAVTGGVAPYTYQWKKGGANISGATGATYSKANVTAADNGSYTCEATDKNGKKVTSTACAVTMATA